MEIVDPAPPAQFERARLEKLASQSAGVTAADALKIAEAILSGHDDVLILMQKREGGVTLVNASDLTLASAVYLLESAKVQLLTAGLK